MLNKQQKRHKRHQRTRAKIFGTAARPRIYVFRSAKHIYLQLIDDEKSRIIASAKDSESKEGRGTKLEKARQVGKLIAKKAKELKIEKVVFDKGGYKYHGRVKAAADGAREGGLKF